MVDSLSGFSAQVGEAAKKLASEIGRSRHIWVMGSGASEIVAHKFTHTLRTIGFSASSMSTEAIFHGDLGAFQNGDTVLFISRAGSVDLERVSEGLQGQNNHKVLITENQSISDQDFEVIVLPKSVEIDPLGIIPSSSFQQFVQFLDQVALCAIEIIGPSYGSTFARSHPSGALGKLFETKIRDALELYSPISLSEIAYRELSVLELEQVLDNSKVGAACISNAEGRMAGIVTDGDVRRHLMQAEKNPIRDILPLVSRNFCFLIDNGTVRDALEAFAANPGVSVMPTLDLQGSVTSMLPARLLPSIFGGLVAQ